MTFSTESGNLILKGIFQSTSTKTHPGRIYSSEVWDNVYEKYLDKLKLEQREENIQALIEDREAEKVSIPISVCSEIDHPNKTMIPHGSYSVSSVDLVDNSLHVDINVHPVSIKKEIDISFNITGSFSHGA